MAAAYEPTDFVQAGTLDKMFRRFASLISNPSAVKPTYNAATGRYENFGEWMALMADGLVYGVQIPKYSYSPVTTAIKTGENAGLVLEASSETKAGRNDYDGRLLFMCQRVNGGVDADGMPYVTAIEGYDDRFDASLQNTWAATPVYYRKQTETAQYVTKEFTDTPRTGFSPCRGAYTPDGELRPFILRACYADSDGQFSTKSGTVPGAWYSAAVANCVQHCASNDFSWTKSRADGLTYLDYGDIAYQIEFMQLMLGAKAPRTAAVGCVSYSLQYTVAQAETGAKRVVLTDAQAANVLVGSSLSVGDGTQTDRYYAEVHNIAKSARVLSKTSLGDGKTAVNLDLAEAIDVTATSKVTSMPWRNGSCDRVLGTFGAPTEAGLKNGLYPFRFQNVEWQLGLYETVHNVYSTVAIDGDQATLTWKVAPDADACSGVNGGAGWTVLAQKTVGTKAGWRYIKDYATEKGAMIPSEIAGTSTTGYCSAFYVSDGAGDREHLVGGRLGSGSVAGVGCAGSYGGLSSANWRIGGRASAIGHSAPAE